MHQGKAYAGKCRANTGLEAELQCMLCGNIRSSVVDYIMEQCFLLRGQAFSQTLSHTHARTHMHAHTHTKIQYVLYL